MKVVIIGGGAAGTAAATRLRRLNENAEILILEKTGELAVANCGLTYFLSEDIEDKRDLIGTTPEKLKRKYNIDVRLNTEVTAINRKEKTVSLAGKADESYDRLIIAIGALQLRPDIEGILTEQVFTLKDLASVERIKDFIKFNAPKNAIVVGGGHTGLETAEALVKLGIHTTIAEASPHLLPQFDEDMAAPLHNYLRSKNLTLYPGQRVTAFDESRVTLSSGESLRYDLAVIATGVSPDLKLPVLADLEIGESGGIKVNEHMQTSDKDIYAAGDAVEVRDFVSKQPIRAAQAGLAVKQAKTAADALGGVDSEFKHALGTSVIKIFDMTAAAAGLNEKKLKENNMEYYKLNLYDWDISSYMQGKELMLFKLLFSPDGQLLGAQGIGKNGIDKRIDTIAAAMQLNAGTAGLENLELCYSPLFSSAKDAVNNLGSMAQNIIEKRVKFAFYDDINQKNAIDGTMIVDIRSPEQFKEGKIPNAVNIPLYALRNNLTSIPHEKKVVLYCQYGVGSYIAACLLSNRGFDNIYVLSGGLQLYREITADRQLTPDIVRI